MLSDLRPIHMRDFALGFHFRGMLREQSSCVCTKRPCQGGSQVACQNFKMSRVGVLSRVESHVAVGN